MSGGGAGLDSTSEANGPPQAGRVDHAAIMAPLRRRGLGMNTITADIRPTTANPDHDRHGDNFPCHGAHAHGLHQWCQPRSSPFSAHEKCILLIEQANWKAGLGGGSRCRVTVTGNA